MSSEQTFSTSDLRSTAQDYKRDAARKHKWALGSVERVGRGVGNPRPHRPSETTFNLKRREAKGAVASLQHGTKVARKHDMLEGTGSAAAASDDSSNTNSDFDDATLSPPADAGVMYSFDAVRAPTQGSQILNAALAKAVETFQEKETVKLVKTEYDVLDSEGESVALAAGKSGKGKNMAKVATVPVSDVDEDYEFV